MPVPVPRVIKPIAHPVVKKTRGTDQTPPFIGIPSGPAPSFTTREEWISSLPSWRRSKPRRIWEEDPCIPEQAAQQDFLQGLALADNAMASKGAHAKCPPPLADVRHAYSMSDVPVGHKHLDRSPVQPSWGADDMAVGDAESALVDVEDDDMDAAETSPNLVFTNLATYEDQTYNHSDYSPPYDDHSPSSDSGPESGSSPLGPVTPFADFVDRALAAEQPYHSEDHGSILESSLEFRQCKEKVAPVFPTLADSVKERAPPVDVVAPCATSAYKKLAEPLSEWLAGYVWKVCTTGMSLPALFRYPS